MPFLVRPIDSESVLLVKATGEARTEDWLDLDAVIAREDNTPDRLLIDLRRQGTIPTSAVAKRVGEHFEAVEAKAVAIVARKGAQYTFAQIVAALAVLRGQTVDVFGDTGAARDWLAEQ